MKTQTTLLNFVVVSVLSLSACGQGAHQIVAATQAQSDGSVDSGGTDSTGAGGAGTATGKSGGAKNFITYNKQIQPIFEKKCSSCHNSHSAVPNWMSYEIAAQGKDKIFQRVIKDKNMPMAPFTMTDSERKLVASWIQQGALKAEPVSAPEVTPDTPSPNPAPNTETPTTPETGGVQQDPVDEPEAPVAPVVVRNPQKELGSKLGACLQCHGTDGNTTYWMFPRLGGQMAPYIETQLKSFRDHSRKGAYSQYMWDIIKDYNDDELKLFAQYFASQKPGVGISGGNPKLILRGKQYFEKGIPSQQVQACTTCHGAQGQGMAMFPRVAGQHSGYLAQQLRAFRNGTRSGTMMPAMVKSLKNSEIKALAAYLESVSSE